MAANIADFCEFALQYLKVKNTQLYNELFDDEDLDEVYEVFLENIDKNELRSLYKKEHPECKNVFLKPVKAKEAVRTFVNTKFGKPVEYDMKKIVAEEKKEEEAKTTDEVPLADDDSELDFIDENMDVDKFFSKRKTPKQSPLIELMETNYEQMNHDRVPEKTLREYIDGHLETLYNYQKYTDPNVSEEEHRENGDIPTGNRLNMKGLEDLAVIDLDFEHEADGRSHYRTEYVAKSTKEEIRNYHLSLLSQEDPVGITPHGGLHIYCYNDLKELCWKNSYDGGGNPDMNFAWTVEEEREDFEGNLYTPVSDFYSFDIRVGVLKNKEAYMNVEGTVIRDTTIKGKLQGKDLKYEFLRGGLDSVVHLRLSTALSLFGIPKSVLQRPKKQTAKKFDVMEIMPAGETLMEAIINEMDALDDAIYNYPDEDTVKRPLSRIHHWTTTSLDEELSLGPIVASILSFENEGLKTKALNKLRGFKCLTTNASDEEKFNSIVNGATPFTYRTLINLFRRYLPETGKALMGYVKHDWKWFVKNFSSNYANSPKLKDFRYEDIQVKCERKLYKHPVALAMDLAKVFCNITGTLEYFQKRRSTKIPHLNEFAPLTDKEFEKLTRKLVIQYRERKYDKETKTYKPTGKLIKTNGYDAYVEYGSHFNVSRQSPLLDWFIGYYYHPMKTPLEEALKTPGIQEMKDHMLKVVFKGHEDEFKFWWEGQKLKYRTHGRLEHFFLIQGGYGSGKTFISDVQNELYTGYTATYTTLKDATDPRHTGGLKGLLYVFVEEMPNYNDKSWDNDILKGMINGNRKIKGRVLYKNFDEMDITFDFAGTSNHDDPYYVDDKNERRLFIATTDDTIIGNKEYFDNLWKNIRTKRGGKVEWNKDFMYALSSILYNEPMDESVDLTKIPFTEKKAEMVKSHQKDNKYLLFIDEYREQLKNDMSGADFNDEVCAFVSKYKLAIKPLNFIKEFNKNCPELRRRSGKGVYYRLDEELEIKYALPDDKEDLEKDYKTELEKKDEQISLLKKEIMELKKKLEEMEGK